ncbi:metal ABC transporter ATP-binding protein [Kocuria sp. M1R5S2]|uniref:metal ABC transporter ATP-binding protein n=1 Tax=Kocuria rhizosphaerae TaxID=3376285 RepID=UPI0037B4CB40
MPRWPAEPAPAVLAARSLDVKLGSAAVLRGVDLSVTAGETVAVLGANGSGKSTLVRALVGAVPATAGRVLLFGADLSGPARLVPRDRVGYAPQRTGATTGVPATALEVVVSGLLHRRALRPGRSAQERALAALAQVGLAGRAHESVQVFSGGQQQRVLVARALVREPALLILDEPFSGMDHETVEALASTVSDLRRRGTTVVVVLHELGPLAGLISRTVVLDGGRVVHDGPARGSDVPAEAHPHPAAAGRLPTAPDLEKLW